MVRANWVWHSYSGLISLFSLLTASVIQESGDVMERIGHVNEMRQKLVGYMGSTSKKDVEPTPGGKNRSARSKSKNPS
jgi:hypothetical protein